MLTCVIYQHGVIETDIAKRRNHYYANYNDTKASTLNRRELSIKGMIYEKGKNSLFVALRLNSPYKIMLRNKENYEIRVKWRLIC